MPQLTETTQINFNISEDLKKEMQIHVIEFSYKNMTAFIQQAIMQQIHRDETEIKIIEE